MAGQFLVYRCVNIVSHVTRCVCLGSGDLLVRFVKGSMFASKWSIWYEVLIVGCHGCGSPCLAVQGL